MNNEPDCRHCGAPAPAEGGGCAAHFNALLALEWRVMMEVLGYVVGARPGESPGERVHFLAVASFNLQHPAAFAPAFRDGLRASLTQVLAGQKSLGALRHETRVAGNGSTRVLAQRVGNVADAPAPLAGWPMRWSVTVADIVPVAPEDYIAAVERWARSVAAELRMAGK
jgi:hypothetical protein